MQLTPSPGAALSLSRRALMLAIRSAMSEPTAACFMKNFIHSVIVTLPSACSKPEFANPSASTEKLASVTVHSVDAIRSGHRVRACERFGWASYIRIQCFHHARCGCFIAAAHLDALALQESKHHESSFMCGAPFRRSRFGRRRSVGRGL